ncbi:MAG: hypothetical protein M3014_00800, partial [Chloroflexota bacterium]|nr:hypothetical protein [Chloroflexota bacterium]
MRRRITTTLGTILVGVQALLGLAACGDTAAPSTPTPAAQSTPTRMLAAPTVVAQGTSIGVPPAVASVTGQSTLG